MASRLVQGVSRRGFLRAGAVGLAAAGLGGTSTSGTLRRQGGDERACILIFNGGGPSHLDLFDPKPDAPEEVRGPFKAIRTASPDIQLTELLPLHARVADRFSLVRTCHYAGPAIHEFGRRLALAGLPPQVVLDGRGEADPACDRYGRTRFGRACLEARRLVEAGVRLVTIGAFGDDGPTWDVHGRNPYTTLAEMRDHVCPAYDRGYTALIDDLHQRGLLGTTMVCTLAEFGRSPRINADGGRDHWTQCWTVSFAGGGVQGGRVVGRSDAHGAYPADRPVTPGEVLATVRRGLGVESAAEPIHELF
jgi:hypothetical protein